jgi:hypothetical protein
MVVAIEEHCEMPRSGSLITWAALVDAVSTAAAKPSTTSCLDQPDNSDAEDDTEPEESSDSDVNDADDAKMWDDEATQTLNAIRTGLLEALEQQLTLPPNPLDDLIGQLGGPAAVAEMTGRSGQQRRTAGGTVVYADRDASNIQEQVMFQDGVKRYAIVSKVPVSMHKRESSFSFNLVCRCHFGCRLRVAASRCKQTSARAARTADAFTLHLSCRGLRRMRSSSSEEGIQLLPALALALTLTIALTLGLCL